MSLKALEQSPELYKIRTLLCNTGKEYVILRREEAQELLDKIDSVLIWANEKPTSEQQRLAVKEVLRIGRQQARFMFAGPAWTLVNWDPDSPDAVWMEALERLDRAMREEK